MLASVYTSALQGFTSYSVNIEAEVRNSEKTAFNIIGLGDNAVKEARDRIQAALKYSGLKMPGNVLVNLAPAEIKKEGSSFDLSIAMAVILASKQIPINSIDPQIAFYGELSLSGTIKPVKGIIAMLLEALESGARIIVLPEDNLNEALLVKGLTLVPVKNLIEVLNYLKAGFVPETQARIKSTHINYKTKDFSDVIGQTAVKRALAIAAAGGHNLLMVGPPGCGKSMLAERFVSLLPPLTEKEILETVKIHSIMSQPIHSLLAGIRPYRSPHHGVSEAGLIGGGSPPRPGEISLAHAGILFLDEFPEYKRASIEAMRAPLETGKVRVTRAKGSYEFPARFQLIAAMNPCPCGRLGVDGKPCLCQMTSIQNYLKRLSQPILDRIDIHIDLKPIPITDISSSQASELVKEFQQLKEQVITARTVAIKRSKKPNAYLSNQQIERVTCDDPQTKLAVQQLANQEKLSARGYFRFLKVARTIADLKQSENVTKAHLAEAIAYRSLDLIGKYCSN